MARVTAIVCAKDEAPRIGAVLSVLVGHPSLDRVLVVDDGSTDDTAKVAKSYGAEVLSLWPNRRKGRAMLEGVRAATDADVIVFFDADLVDLQPWHVQALVDPVARGQYAMVVGMRDYGPEVTEITRHLPLISGERAVRRDMLLAMPEAVFQGFGVEVAMNDAVYRMGGRIGTVVLEGLSIVLKWEKNPEKGAVDMLRMGTEVARSMVKARQRASVGEVAEAPPPASVEAECDTTECVMDKLAGSIVRAAGPFARDELWTPEVQDRVGKMVGDRVATPFWISACCGSYLVLGPIGACATGLVYLFTRD